MTPQDRPLGAVKTFVAPAHASVDILKMLTDLEECVLKAKHFPPLGMMFGFNEENFTTTLMKIRANLPEELKKAQKVTKDSEQISDNARHEADQLVSEARTLAANELDRCKRDAAEMQSVAQKEAEHSINEAREQAQHILAEAEARAEEMLLETAVVQAAQTRADKIEQEAEEEATYLRSQASTEAQQMLERSGQESNALRKGADDYAHETLITLESALSKAIVQIQHGREALER